MARKVKMGADTGVIPSRKGAPAATPPVATTVRSDALAPWPLIDRFPLVQGQSLTSQYLASVYRLATTGYRQQFVDLLNELLEHDPHLFSVIQKRILSTANGRLDVTSAELPDGDPDKDLADEIRDLVIRELGRIPDMAQSLAGLLWGVYYGVSAAEIFWTRDSDGWHVQRLGFIHSRRLSYPDQQAWDLYVWDQGQVYGWGQNFNQPTNRATFGLRVADYPGKFIVFAPQLRGDYPTRDGTGREVAQWSIFKRVGARGAVEYLERFAKPYQDVTYTTTDTGKPREADKDDIALASQIAAAIGPGSGSFAAHADSIKIEPKSPDAGKPKITWPEWIAICDAQISKAILGGTLGTDVGKGGGNRSLGEVQERGEVDLEQYDANVLAEAFRRDIITWIVRLNRPEAMHLIPRVAVHVDTDPDPDSLADLATKLTKIGAPVDLEALSDQTGIKLVPNPDPSKPRRTFMCDVTDPTQVDDSLISDAAKAQKQQAVDAQNALAQAKAQNPAPNPNAPQDPNQPPQKGTPPGVDPNAKGGKPGKPAKGKKAKNPAIRSAQEAKDDRKMRLLLADRPDSNAAGQVYEQLLGDYPAKSLDWILDAPWEGPVVVDLDDIDFSNRDSWRASHENIDSYIDKVKDGRLKPAILVKRPGEPKLLIVDGHHRTLAAEKLKRKLLAYVGAVDGKALKKAEELHSMQKKGSSKRAPASQMPSYGSSVLPSVSGSVLPSFAGTSVLPSFATQSLLPSFRGPSR